MKAKSPSMTARLKPAVFSNGEPVEMRRRDIGNLWVRPASQCRVLAIKSSRARGQFSRPCRGSRHTVQRRLPGRHDHSGCTLKRALAQLQSEQAAALERARQRQFAGLEIGKAETAVIRRVAEQDHRAMATFARGRQSLIDQRGAHTELAKCRIDRERT